MTKRQAAPSSQSITLRIPVETLHRSDRLGGTRSEILRSAIDRGLSELELSSQVDSLAEQVSALQSELAKVNEHAEAARKNSGSAATLIRRLADWLDQWPRIRRRPDLPAALDPAQQESKPKK